ncbi:MAG: hypothetical protein HYX92_14260 [Chloroflexi bacterium]|nr:hypothetical protein [Chloroflexota bacterium]
MARLTHLMNPIGDAATPQLKLAPRPSDLNGKVMGILDNRMGESTALLETIAGRISQRYRLAGRETATPAGNTPGQAAEELSKCDFVVAGFGWSGVYTIWAVQGAVELEQRGIPTVMVCTEGIDAMCQAEARCKGMPSLPLLSIPVAEEGRMSQGAIEKATDSLMDDIIFCLTQPATKVAEMFARRDLVVEAEKEINRPHNKFTMESVTVDKLEQATTVFYEQGWTDGLPVVPPTREAVEAMLAHTDRRPEEVVGLLAPRMGKATVEKIAVNAVMAGCLPEYLPVLIASVEAMAEPAFNLSGLQSTMNPAAPLAIVNGPLRKQLGINSGFNVFGQGWRSNATIGRAIRLILMNIGGGVPGVTDRALQGLPDKFTFCIGENEDESPWEPLHVERGFPKEASTVTMVGVEGHHNFLVLDQMPETILAFAADAMGYLGANTIYYGGQSWPVLALNPFFAKVLARQGYSKIDVKRYMFEHAAAPLSRFPESIRPYIDKHQIRKDAAAETVVSATGPMEDIVVIVTGSDGAHAQYLATMGHFIQPVTKAISFKDGSPVRRLQDLMRSRR